MEMGVTGYTKLRWACFAEIITHSWLLGAIWLFKVTLTYWLKLLMQWLFFAFDCQTAFATANEEKAKNAKLKQKKRKIKTEQKQMHEDNCFQCGDGGELVMCDKKDCPKAYHLLCLNLTQPPFGKCFPMATRCFACFKDIMLHIKL